MTEDLNLIASFLARRDVAALSPEYLREKVDVVALIGSSLIGPIEVAAEAVASGNAERILVAGGIGHSTQNLRDNVSMHPSFTDIATAGRPEADIMRDILIGHFGIDPERIIVENRSTNCGSNASESRRILDDLGIKPKRLAIVQDPTMQLRTHASFERAWIGVTQIEFISFAPFIPYVRQAAEGFVVEGDHRKIWPFKRFVSLILGEISRLRDDDNGYGPQGRNFIDHIDLPQSILEAHLRVSQYFDQRSVS